MFSVLLANPPPVVRIPNSTVYRISKISTCLVKISMAKLVMPECAEISNCTWVQDICSSRRRDTGAADSWAHLLSFPVHRQDSPATSLITRHCHYTHHCHHSLASHLQLTPTPGTHRQCQLFSCTTLEYLEIQPKLVYTTTVEFDSTLDDHHQSAIELLAADNSWR